jgi:hypothetical protein
MSGPYIEDKDVNDKAIRQQHIYLEDYPQLPQDATNKDYVDDVLASLNKTLRDYVDAKIATSDPTYVAKIWTRSRETIPAGYGLCDGLWYDPADTTAGQVGQGATDATHTVQTPNYLNKFLVGAGDTYAIDATGGQATMSQHSHSVPAHSHASGTIAVASHGTHSHTTPTHSHSISFTSGTEGAHTHTGGSHDHGLNSHTHTGPSHNHSVSITSGNPSATLTHTVTETGINSYTGSSTYAHIATSTGNSPTANSAHVHSVSVADHAAHTHSVSGNSGDAGTGATGAASGSTAAGGAVATGVGSSHSHAVSGTTATDGSGTSGDSAALTHSVSGSTASDGSGTSGTAGTGVTADENRPPYTAVFWIMKL